MSEGSRNPVARASPGSGRRRPPPASRTGRVRFAAAVLFLLLPAAAAAAAELGPLPPPPANPDNPATEAKAELGRLLFFDRRLSGDGTMNCATCHDPETGYGDGLPISQSYPTTKNWRNAPPLVNVAYRQSLFWDGRAATLEEQALFPVMSPFEMNRNLDLLEEELRSVPGYVEAFREVFGGEVSRERVAMALAAFQRTIVSRETPLDRYLLGDREALTPLQKRGLEVFSGKGRCAACHDGPALSDGKFHALGVPEDPDVTGDPRVAATRRFVAKTAGYPEYRELSEDLGRFLVTKDPRDRKAFLTPMLREVASTGPYMHNGAFRTLREVIEFFDRGGGAGNGGSPLLEPLRLTAQEKEALEAFLAGALSGPVPRVRPPKLP